MAVTNQSIVARHDAKSHENQQKGAVCHVGKTICHIGKKSETKEVTRHWKIWREGDYIYVRAKVSAKKGYYLDVTEQTVEQVPEILARLTFAERVKQRARAELIPLFREAGINNCEVEFIGEPELIVSTTLNYGPTLTKFLAFISHDFYKWTLVGVTLLCRVKLP